MQILMILGWALSLGASLYSLVLIARVLLDWLLFFNPEFTPRGIFLVVCNLMYSLTDPPVNWLRRFIPPLRFGNVAIDVGYIVLFAVVALLTRLGSWLIYLA